MDASLKNLINLPMKYASGETYEQLHEATVVNVEGRVKFRKS